MEEEKETKVNMMKRALHKLKLKLKPKPKRKFKHKKHCASMSHVAYASIVGARSRPESSSHVSRDPNRQGVGDNSRVSEWVSNLQRRLALEPRVLRGSSGRTSCSIHRVPPSLRRDHEEKDYLPQIISIGPFHRDKNGKVLAMEEHKWKYVSASISRNGNIHFAEIVMAISELEESARECYSETIDLSSYEFVEMMIGDGCFIIELLCRAAEIFTRVGDPIFELPWLLHTLQADLLLLENQIPYDVLQRIFHLLNIPSYSSVTLASLAIKFFNNLVPTKNRIMKENPDQTYKHLLHLLHSNLLSREMMKLKLPSRSDDDSHIKMIHCVTELGESGIKFKMSNADCFLDIKYKKGVITIPHLRIDDSTNSLLLNLIALEQCHCYCGNYFTVYTTFMDCLINSAKDVEVLRQNQIIDNWLGSDEVVANLFNTLGRGVTIAEKEFYLVKVFEGVDKYYNNTCHQWKASLIHKYFYNPWAIISLFAAIMLLLLTFMQTLFSGMSLKK